MSTTIRAKFYVASVTINCNQQPMEGEAPNLYTLVNFNAAYSPNPSTENHAYWTATPTGSLAITVTEEQAQNFKPGSFWYIDSLQDENGDWEMDVRTGGKEDDCSLNVELTTKKSTQFQWARLKLSINNKSAWSEYEKINSRYQIDILPAVKS